MGDILHPQVQQLIAAAPYDLAVAVIDQEEAPGQIGLREADDPLVHDSAKPLFALAQGLFHLLARGDLRLRSVVEAGALQSDRTHLSDDLHEGAFIRGEYPFLRPEE